MNRTNFIRDYQKIMQHLENENFSFSKCVIHESRLTVRIPVSFSVSEQPDETIELLRELYTFGKCENVEEILFDYSECEFLGLSASTIMDIILIIIVEYRKKTKKLKLFGRFPKNQMVKDILLESGLLHHLNFGHKIEYDKHNVEKFDVVSGEVGGDDKLSGTIATELTDYFNRCLLHQGMKLNNDGILFLVTLLGEVIDNCEIHGGEQATWYTQGHYEDNIIKNYGEMQLLFLNLGKTIYEGLEYDSSKETKERLEYFYERHDKFLSPNWNKEMIFTVFALQEGISRLRDKNVEGYETRGTGTVSLIENLSLIGKCDDGQVPEMTIISGRTYIKFDGRYEMKEKSFENDPAFGSGKKKIIAFNKENDIYKPPDSKNVYKLEENFPGTVISLRFYLDKRYIQKEKGERKHE